MLTMQQAVSKVHLISGVVTLNGRESVLSKDVLKLGLSIQRQIL